MSRTVTCERCGGVGFVPADVRHKSLRLVSRECPSCEGRGTFTISQEGPPHPNPARSRLENALMQQIVLAGLPTPCTEYRFHPTRRWRFDFAWPSHMLAVELEGGIWLRGGGGHNTGAGFEADCEKYNEAALLGWRVLRFTNHMLDSGNALSSIERALLAADR